MILKELDVVNKKWGFEVWVYENTLGCKLHFELPLVGNGMEVIQGLLFVHDG